MIILFNEELLSFVILVTWLPSLTLALIFTSLCHVLQQLDSGLNCWKAVQVKTMDLRCVFGTYTLNLTVRTGKLQAEFGVCIMFLAKVLYPNAFTHLRVSGVELMCNSFSPFHHGWIFQSPFIVLLPYFYVIDLYCSQLNNFSYTKLSM